ncbi:MAG: uracil-DNA glycosylase [Spirochaetes bacterium]|nr:uracil-DNA glycosylase [Spirochaetota bacterium]
METNESRLLGMAEEVERCDKCRLCTTRTRTVFGEGNPDAEVLFIGEGPGKQEDITGRPFVGRAGELLTRIIEFGMGVPRSEVYIANLVKCRPTVDMNLMRDRPPDPDELQACVPYLMAQIDIIRPRVIVALGSPSSKFLLATTSGITRIRGRWGEYRGIPVMPTYHPSYLLRNGGDSSPLKREVWHDIKIVMERLGWPLPRIKRGEKG